MRTWNPSSCQPYAAVIELEESLRTPLGFGHRRAGAQVVHSGCTGALLRSRSRARRAIEWLACKWFRSFGLRATVRISRGALVEKKSGFRRVPPSPLMIPATPGNGPQDSAGPLETARGFVVSCEAQRNPAAGCCTGFCTASAGRLCGLAKVLIGHLQVVPHGDIRGVP